MRLRCLPNMRKYKWSANTCVCRSPCVSRACTHTHRPTWWWPMMPPSYFNKLSQGFDKFNIAVWRPVRTASSSGSDMAAGENISAAVRTAAPLSQTCNMWEVTKQVTKLKLPKCWKRGRIKLLWSGDKWDLERCKEHRPPCHLLS